MIEVAMPSMNTTTEWQQLPKGWNVRCVKRGCTEEATRRHRVKFISGNVSEWFHVCETHALLENLPNPLPEMPLATSR
jgi:hypothetical protein